jgi:hypothetical protein
MNIKKNSLESQTYNKNQVKYNYLNRYDKEKEYKLKRVYTTRPFVNNLTYGTNNSNLGLYLDNLFPLYTNMAAYN